ncbi:MAG: hypothetical protein U1E63_17555 [Burkholderiales bacterium]
MESIETLDRALIAAIQEQARAALSSLLSGRVPFHPTETEVGGKPRRTCRIEASPVT